MRSTSTHEKQHEVPKNLGDEGGISYLLEDRISLLPDEILIGIISPFSIKEAARTCVLSKRWRFLWRHVTCLNFDDIGASPVRDNTVNEVLQLHEGTVDGFRINGSYYSSNYVDNWVKFAIRKQVQRLEIDRKKKDAMCPGKPLNDVSCIKSLRHLSLKHINISGEFVGQVLSDCQLLEHLCICGSQDLYALKAVGPSLRLKFLQISECGRLVRVDISAPNLVSFIYDGTSVYRRGIVLKHAPSLVNVSLAEDMDCITKPFLAIQNCFSHLQTLNLCMDLRRENIKLPEFPELSALKDLSMTIYTRYNGQSLLDLTSLLERSPFLHRLTLQLRWVKFQESYTSYTQEIKRCPHQCLKVVKLSGFIGIGSVVDTEFAMYLIENAVVLEKLIIDLEKGLFVQRRSILPEFATTEWKLKATREHALQLGTQLPPGAEFVVI